MQWGGKIYSGTFIASTPTHWRASSGDNTVIHSWLNNIINESILPGNSSSENWFPSFIAYPRAHANYPWWQHYNTKHSQFNSIQFSSVRQESILPGSPADLKSYGLGNLTIKSPITGQQQQKYPARLAWLPHKSLEPAQRSSGSRFVEIGDSTGRMAGRQSGVRTTVDKFDPGQSDVVVNLWWSFWISLFNFFLDFFFFSFLELGQRLTSSTRVSRTLL